MAAAGHALLSVAPTDQADLSSDVSNVSSPLSDVEVDKDGGAPDGAPPVGSAAAPAHLQHDAGPRGDSSDSESNMSDGADTEAETERLFDTPRAQRQKDVIVDEFNESRVFEHTPSALRRTIDVVVAAAASPGDNEDEASDRHASSSPNTSHHSNSHADDEQSPVKKTEAPSRDSSSSRAEYHSGARERKRKRSPAPAPLAGSDPDQHRREAAKRSHSEESRERGARPEHDQDQDVPMVAGADAEVEAETMPTRQSSSERSLAHDAARPAAPAEPAEAPSPSPAEPAEPATRPGRASKKKKKKKTVKSGPKRGGDEDASHANADTPSNSSSRSSSNGGENGQEPEHGMEEEPDGAEPEEEEAEHADKTVEEGEKRQAAYSEWISIDAMFGLFTERLYRDRLEKLEEEERSLLADEPYHPEYLAMIQVIDSRLQRQLLEAKREHELKTESQQRVGAAQRAQIWSQFYQEIREIRQASLEGLNEEWYDVQASRRGGHAQSDHILLFPKERGQQARNAAAYNTEVASLASLARYEGFPAVPSIRGAMSHEIQSDLDAIKQAKRQRQQQQQQSQQQPQWQQPQQQQQHKQPANTQQVEGFQATPTTSLAGLGPAAEQFIKENPWANPRHPAHKARHADGTAQLDSSSGSPLGAMAAATQATLSRNANVNGHAPGPPDRIRPRQMGSASPHPSSLGAGAGAGSVQMMRTGGGGPGLSALAAAINGNPDSAKKDSSVTASS